jgi:hypothetical protein
VRINPFNGPTPARTDGDRSTGRGFADALRRGRDRTQNPPPGGPVIKPPVLTTQAVGEEGGDGLPPGCELPPAPGPISGPKPETVPRPLPVEAPPIATTLSIGEEGGGPPPDCEIVLPPPGPKPSPGPVTQPPVKGPPDRLTTLAIGEEGGGPTPDAGKQPTFTLPNGAVGARGPFFIDDPAPQPLPRTELFSTSATDPTSDDL